jgi:hypothetical protein
MVDYFTKAEAADKSNREFYDECIEAAANVLKLAADLIISAANIEVIYYQSVGVIEVKIDSRIYHYIDSIPKINKYPSRFKVDLTNYKIFLHSMPGLKDITFYFSSFVRIYGDIYSKINDGDVYRGYLSGKMYMSYKNN